MIDQLNSEKVTVAKTEDTKAIISSMEENLRQMEKIISDIPVPIAREKLSSLLKNLQSILSKM